uniref:Calponin-homology (CH) domain-containing protein n=1 Tax=Pygocentrus nattereri TaxID=42514 RepID=A0A3B4DD30_PYGNA
GEVLSRFQLQEDFQSFSTNSSANAKLNNFTRLEPTLQLLGIPFDLSMAKAVMQGQPGAATRLLYQLYILLQKKKRSGLTGTALETMQPAATARLHRIENHIYTQRLRAVVKREADEKMQKITQRFDKRGQEMYGRSVMAELVHEEKRRHLQEERRLQDIEKHRQARKKQQEIMERIETAAVRLPKPPMSRSLRAPRKQQRQQEAQNVHQQIAQFEKSRKRLSPASYGPTSFSVQVTRAVSEDEMAQWNNEYVQKIRQRLEEDATAREQREKRRRRALIQQLHTHHTHEMVREEQLIARLVRQSQQEKRIAVQLMQIRQQKEVLRQNRILRQRQYEEQRLTDFHQALDREAALLQQDRVEHQEEIRKERELHAHLAAERTQSKHQKHFNICSEILKQIVDLATKSGEYRLLTATAIPLKMMREWKELYFIGKPLYKVSELELGAEPAEPSPEQAIELEKLNILNQQDYDEYTNMMGEWTWPEEGESRAPPTNNDILGHVVARLQNIVNPPCLNDPSPQFPNFSLRACVLGKVCSGKSTCLTRISEAHGIHILSADTLIQEALAAHQAGEQVPNDHSPECCVLVLTQPTLRAQHGAVVEKALRRGGAIPDELLIDIFIHVPEGRGWVLDGFPANVSQARLLEKALSGADPDQADRKRRIKKPNLVEDRNAPKAPPPPLPALHLAMLLEVSDEQVLDRAIHRSRESTAFMTLPLFTHSFSFSLVERNQTLSVPHWTVLRRLTVFPQLCLFSRIAAFQDTWSKLEKWFGEKQKILVKVSAEVNEDALFRSVETVLFNTMTAAQKGLHLLLLSNHLSLSLNTVMQNLRSERNLIIHHLYNIREDFKQYLQRPDLKQEFVSVWQRDYNSIPDDMRQDEETKAELHHRLDELRERLWDICDKRREEAMEERARVIGDGWLEDHTALLINHYSTLMQVEVDRFQDTLRVLRDYYTGMYRRVLPEAPQDFTCIPLLDITNNNGSQTDRTKRWMHLSIWIYLYFLKSTHIYVSIALCVCVCVEGAARQRLELVKLHALSVVHSVQHRAEQTHTDMQEWLDQRFTSEMDSIQQLSGVVQHHIENSLKIPHQLVLDCTDFFIDGETRVLPTTPTPPRPPPLERTNHRTLSILQLHGLRAQLHKIAPTGLENTELCKVLQELTSLTMGSDALPEAWMNLTDSQVQELVCVLSQDREVVDWRQFLLSAAQPWPLPSQNQLLRTLTRFREEDTAASGVLTLEQYRQVELWFSSQADVPVPEDPTEPLPYDRLANLKEFFFALFADAASSTAVLDYLTMLLYFCCHPDPGQGFTRALSIVTQHKHQYRHPSPLLQDLVKVFKELGFDAGEKIPFSMLSQHPFLQDLMEGSSQYLLADIHRVLHVPKSDGEPSTFT